LLVAGTALWDLLPAYGKTKNPPEAFSKLLADVLELDVERARELQAEGAYQAFPPFPHEPLDTDLYALVGSTPLIIESSFIVRYNKKTARYRAHAGLRLRVEREFHRLNSLLNPEEWPELCPIIWDNMKRVNGGWEGALRLPGVPRKVHVNLVDSNVAEFDAAQSEVELLITARPWVIEGRWKFRMTPESARPGWTQILHEREITFAPEVRPYERETLAYWMKSDIACLAFS
jgi:hypothetical protein